MEEPDRNQRFTKEVVMERGTRSLWILPAVAFIFVFALAACGGGKKKIAPKPVNWKSVDTLGVSMKVPDVFKKNPAGGSDSVQYMYKGGIVYINIEKGKLEEGGLEGLFRKEHEARAKETRKRKKSKDAYKILEKKDITLGGKKALEIEQEFMTGTGDMRAHNIVVYVDLGNEQLLTLKWHIEDIKEVPWEKTYNRFFKESRASLDVK
jgi:uncharacterized lipoprotein YehR (DUF1307 family)